MDKKHSTKPTIVQTLISKVLIIAVASIFILSFLWISTEYFILHTDSAVMRQNLLKAHKELIKNEVDKVKSYIEYRQNQVETKTKHSIRQRVKEAHTIAMHIFEEHKKDLPMALIKERVKEALRPIRFNHGRGYYFAFNLDGIEELFADRPEMEGKNMLYLKNVDGQYVIKDMLEIIKNQEEGFYAYRWTKPNMDGYFPKFAFVKLLKPFGWVIGAGEYPDDVEHDIQKEILDYIEQIHYHRGGYIFVSRWNGVSLTNPGKGKNNLDVTDVNGIKVVRELIRLSKLGGGFLSYVMPKFSDKRQAPKLAYVTGIPEWQWYVGTGIYTDEIESAIAEKNTLAKNRIIQNICIILSICALLILIVSLLAMRVVRKTNHNIELISDFFKKAAVESTPINPDNIDFTEFEVIAHSANEMTKARSQAEENLRKSEERLALALDSVSDAVWDWQVESGEVYFSSRWYTMLGYEPYELPQKFETWRNLLHPDDLEASEQTVIRHLRLGEPFEIEFRMKTKDNAWKWILARGKTVKVSTNGKPLRMLGTHMNITERKQAEIALLNSEKKWRNILVNTPQIGISLNTRGEIIFANTHFLKLTGWTEAEIIGQDWFEKFIPENNRQEAQNTFLKLLDQKEIYDFSTYENEIVDKEGKPHIVAWSNVLTRDKKGNLVDITSLGVDLTERQQAEEKLKKSEARYRTMMEAIKDPVYISSQDFRIQYMNKAMIERVGHDAVGESCYKALHHLDEICSWCQSQKSFQESHFETNIVSPKDNRSYNISSSVFVNEDESLSKISVFRDTTDFNTLQRRLQQSQKMESIGNLAGGIAHDFNNILFPIIGMTELLLEDLPQESEEYENTQEILRAAKRGSDLVKQILTFSRQTEHKLIPVRVQQVLKEVMKLMRSTIPSYVEITEDIQSDCGMIVADPAQIHQVAMNIITNAYHAVESSGGKIAVTLKEVDLAADKVTEELPGDVRYILITVKDSGHGIPLNLMNKIFEPYFTTKEQGKGTGLGLAVAYGIVKKHKGDIKVSSTLGQGTCFSIYLPLMDTSVDTEMIVPKQIEPKGNERLLIIDDEKPIGTVGKQMLERLGYTVTFFINSTEALEAFKDSPDQFDLVITDMTMPFMTGDQLAREIKTIRPDIPVIICTGFSDRINKEKAYASGINGFLLKPIVKSEMAQMVRKALDETKSPS